MNELLYANKKVIGQSLARLRKEEHMTQAELADALNERLGTRYQGSAISAWENATNSINADFMPLLADILNVTLGKLYGQSVHGTQVIHDVCETVERHLTDEETQEVSQFISFLLYRRNHELMPSH